MTRYVALGFALASTIAFAQAPIAEKPSLEIVAEERDSSTTYFIRWTNAPCAYANRLIDPRPLMPGCSRPQSITVSELVKVCQYIDKEAVGDACDCRSGSWGTMVEAEPGVCRMRLPDGSLGAENHSLYLTAWAETNDETRAAEQLELLETARDELWNELTEARVQAQDASRQALRDGEL